MKRLLVALVLCLFSSSAVADGTNMCPPCPQTAVKKKRKKKPAPPVVTETPAVTPAPVEKEEEPTFCPIPVRECPPCRPCPALVQEPTLWGVSLGYLVVGLWGEPDWAYSHGPSLKLQYAEGRYTYHAELGAAFGKDAGLTARLGGTRWLLFFGGNAFGLGGSVVGQVIGLDGTENLYNIGVAPEVSFTRPLGRDLWVDANVGPLFVMSRLENDEEFQAGLIGSVALTYAW